MHGIGSGLISSQKHQSPSILLVYIYVPAVSNAKKGKSTPSMRRDIEICEAPGQGAALKASATGMVSRACSTAHVA